jgi:hypothetical protein
LISISTGLNERSKSSMAALDTEQRPTLANRISLGGIALIVAGLANLIQAILSVNTYSNPHTDQVEVALEAATLVYRVRLALSPVYLAFFILGVLALYAYLSQTKEEKLAFAGLVVSLLFIALFLPVIGFAAYVFPAIGDLVRQGQEEMIAVMDEAFLEPFIVIPFFGGILWNIGPILMGAAIWRSGLLWKWGGLLLIIQGLLGIPGFLDMPVPAIIGGILGGVGQIALGISLFQSVRRPDALEVAGAAGR